MTGAPGQALRARQPAAGGHFSAPVFTLAETRRACVRAFLRGQGHRESRSLPQHPPPEEIDRLIAETLRERGDAR